MNPLKNYLTTLGKKHKCVDLQRHSKKAHTGEWKERAKEWKKRRDVFHLIVFESLESTAVFAGDECECERHERCYDLLKNKPCRFCRKMFKSEFNKVCHERTYSDEHRQGFHPRNQQGYGREDLENDETGFITQ